MKQLGYQDHNYVLFYPSREGTIWIAIREECIQVEKKTADTVGALIYEMVRTIRDTAQNETAS